MDDAVNRKIGAVIQFFQLIISIVISIVFTSYMLSKLNQAEYGIYSVCASTIGYLSLLSLGLNSSYIRYYTRAREKLDGISIEELNWHYITAFLIFGIVAFVLGMIIGCNANILFNEEYTAYELETASVILKLLACNMALDFPTTVFSSYIASQQRYIFLKVILLLKTVVSPLTQFILLFLGYGSIGMTVGLVIVNIAIDIVYVLFCLSKLNMKFKRSRFNYKFLKMIFSFSVFIGINQIVNQINFNVDKLLLSKLSEVRQIAVYSVAATINSHFEQVGSSIASLYDTKINIITQSHMDKIEKKRQLDDIFIKVGRIQFYILMLITTGFLFFGEYFVGMWAGTDYQESYYIILLLIFPLCVPLFQNTAVYIQRAQYKHKFRSILYLCTSVINIVLSIFFVNIWGAIGAALGTTIILTANSIIINIYYKRVLNLNIVLFWKNIIRIARGLIMPSLWGVVSWYIFPCINLFSFICNVFIYIIIYFISMFFFSFNESEKKGCRIKKDKLQMF